MLSSVLLVAEDEPSLAVGRKLVSETPPLLIYAEKNGHGYGKLRVRTSSYQQMGAKGLPVLMLTDLDDDPCPSHKVNEWLGASPTTGFLFRICVREMEAWLLAHRDAMANFLGIVTSRIPTAPELIADPKKKLIALAEHSKHRAIRLGFKPLGSATIGPEYNRLLSRYVSEFWDAPTAAKSAPSLARARHRLRELAKLVAVP